MAEPHVLSALKAKRAEIGGYIHGLEQKMRKWRARLANIDATIRIFSPETDPHAIPPKQVRRQSGYFRRGEFGRLCMDELRKANGAPLRTKAIVIGVMKSKGLPDDPALVEILADRAKVYLRASRKLERVTKSGTTRNALWVLASN
jgi:hypothetical protein